jgi:hypothetical protein
MNAATVEKLFTLISDFGIGIGEGPIDDDRYHDFRTAYLKWSGERDRELHNHLAQTPTLFRVYLPFSTRILHTAMQIAWCMDEIIFRDPIETLLANPSHDALDIEQQKWKLRMLVEKLLLFRWPIVNGYYLLRSFTSAPRT